MGIETHRSSAPLISMTAEPDGRTTEPPDPALRPTSTAARAILVLGAACLVQTVVLYHAHHYGVLAGLLPWDDCLVVLRGIENLESIAGSNSVYAMLRAVRYLNVHAPLSDVQTMAGLLLSGGAVWGPFVLNLVPILLALFAIFYRPERMNGWLVAAIVILVLVQPLTINALTYVKSDWKGGVLIAAAVYLLNESAERRSVRHKVVGAVVLGLGLTSKLTAFYYPVLAVAILLAFEAYEWILAGTSRRGDAEHEARHPSRYGWREARVLLLCIALALLPYTAFFLVYLRPTLTYIAYALGDTWTDRLTAVERVAYYTPASADGAAAWGRLHIVFGTFAAACVAIAVARRTYRRLLSLACVLLLALLFLAPLVVARTSNITFGAGFMGIIMGGTLIAMVTVARAFPRWGGLATFVITTALVVGARLPLSASAYGPAWTPRVSQLQQLAWAYERIERVMNASSAPTPRVLVFYDNIFAPHPNLSILHFERTSRLLSVARVDDLSEVAGAGTLLEQAEFALTYVVAGVDSVVGKAHGLNPRFPVSVHPGVADAFIAARPEFERVHAERVPGGDIHVYRNMRIAAAQQSVAGGAPASGPDSSLKRGAVP